MSIIITENAEVLNQQVKYTGLNKQQTVVHSRIVSSTPQVVKKSKSIKAPAVKAAVLVKRAHGEPERKIARDLKIARQTVHSIIDQADLDQQMQHGLILCSDLIPESVRVIKHRLEKNSESAAFGILNPLVLSRAAQANPQRMTADVNLQVAIKALITPNVDTPVQVIDSTVVTSADK